MEYNIMHFLAYLFLAIVLVVVFREIANMWLDGKIVVDTNERQRVVCRNCITGNLSVLGQGTHYPPPWIFKDVVVDLNKEPHSTDDDRPAKSSDGASVFVKMRYNTLTGRKFNKETGQVTGDEIDHEHVLWSVTRTDFEKRAKYVADIIETVIDAIIAQYTSDELFLVGNSLDGEEPLVVNVPKHSLDSDNIPWNKDWIVKDIKTGTETIKAKRPFTKEIKAKDKKALLKSLALYIECEINFRLRKVGFSVDEVLIENLSPSKDVQKSMDRLQVLKNEKRALLSTGKNIENLSAVEMLAIDTDQLGATAISAALREVAPLIVSAIEKMKGEKNENG